MKMVKVEEARRLFLEFKGLLISYKTHEVFHIEAWQEISYIPGGPIMCRVHYIYDRCEKKAFFQNHFGEIKMVDGAREIRSLERFIRHPIRFMKEGIFIRKLNRINYASSLFYLICMMDGHEVVNRRPGASNEEYRAKKAEYLKMIFNQIIEVK